MTSIQDVADQINAKLDQINNNTSETVAVGNGIRADLGQIDADLKAGIGELSADLFAVWEQAKVTNSVLEYQIQQNNTIICLLENSNDLLCGMTRKLTRQLELSERQLASVMRLEGIAERTNAAAAADFDRHAALEAEIRKCCPPPEVEPEPCPAPCPKPKEHLYRPKGQDLKPPQRQEPVR